MESRVRAKFYEKLILNKKIIILVSVLSRFSPLIILVNHIIINLLISYYSLAIQNNLKKS